MAPQLRVTWGSGDSTFDETVRVHIGSGSRCQVRIDSLTVDEAVVLEPTDGMWVIRVRPGVMVSSSASGTLKPGATVPFTEATNLTIDGETVSLIPQSSPGTSQSTREEPAPVRQPATNTIQVTTAAGSQDLTPGTYVVGRAKTADIRVQASDIGRQHATLAFRDGAWWFIDQSKNGSFISDRRITDPVAVTGTVHINLGSPAGQRVVLQSTQAAVTQEMPQRAATPAASVVQHDRLELELDRSHVELIPGIDEAVEFVLQAQNRHPTEVLTVSLRAASADGDPAWLTFGSVDGLTAGEVHLQPNGGAAQVICRLTVPRLPSSRPGVYSFTIEGTEGTGTPKAVNVAVRVLPFLDVTVEEPASRKTKSRRARPQKRPIVFSNGSNVAVQVQVPHADEAEQLLIGGNAMALQLAPGARTTFNALLSLAEKPSFFERRELPYRISGTVEATEGRLVDTWDFNGSYLKRPMVPLWILIAIVPLTALLLVLAMSLKWWPFEDDAVFSMPEVSTSTSKDLALQQIAERVPCQIIDPAIGTTGGRCVVTVVREPSAQEPGTIVRTEPNGGHVFPDPNNMVIKLFEAEPLPVLPVAGTYTGASLQRAVDLIRQNIIDPPQYSVTADQVFVTVNHPETPIERVNLANVFGCEPICEATVVGQSLAANAPIEQDETVEITLTVQDIDEPTPVPAPTAPPTPEPAAPEPTEEPTEEPAPEPTEAPTPAIATPVPFPIPTVGPFPVPTIGRIPIPFPTIGRIPRVPFPNGGIAGAEGQAYAWANNQSVGEYKPANAYAFPSDEAPTIKRTGEGNYVVTFPTTPTSGGNAQVSTYGSSALCSLVSWSNNDVTVRCVKSGTSTPVDARFTVRWMHDEDAAYAFVPESTRSSEPIGWVNNPTNGSVKVNRASVGIYGIVFENASLTNGNVQVSAYGSAAPCYPSGWRAETIRIACVDTETGNPVDSRFSVLHIKDGTHVAARGTGTNLTILAANNPSNGLIQVRRIGTGRYTATFNGTTLNSGYVSVTSLGPVQCSIDGWGASAITVTCRDFDGDLADVGVSILHHK